MGPTSPPDVRLDPAWTPALRQFAQMSRRWSFGLLLCGVFGAAAGVGVKLAYPSPYTASEQVLFDPQGMKLFAADDGGTRFDANAQIDYVESQMGVLMSERVLSRLYARACQAPSPGFSRYCGQGQPSARALEALRASLAVKRAERSFLVDVVATAQTPEFAAALAAGLVQSYLAENAASRAETAQRLGGDLDRRIATLRRDLSESEKQAETYRRDADLTRVGDKLVIELKLTDATNGLDAAETRLALAQARVNELQATPENATGLGALGDEAETRPLTELLERRAQARADLAPLASKLGARNPELIQAQSRVSAVERDVARELGQIRAAARAQLSRSQRERDAFAQSAQRLTAELNSARQSQIALAALDENLAANRKLIDALESRAREIAEAGRLDLANLRIASQARAPASHNAWASLAAFGALGFVLALLMALAALAVAAAFATEAAPVESLREAARRLRAEVA